MHIYVCNKIDFTSLKQTACASSVIHGIPTVGPSGACAPLTFKNLLKSDSLL